MGSGPLGVRLSSSHLRKVGWGPRLLTSGTFASALRGRRSKVPSRPTIDPGLGSPLTYNRAQSQVLDVGECIYCGAKPPVSLTREHVFPDGLAGGIILRNASCEPCRKVTHEFETASLTGPLLSIRAKHNLRYGKNRGKPESIRVRIGRDEPPKFKDVLIREYPNLIPMPSLPKPGYLDLRPRGLPGIVSGRGVVLNLDEVKRLCVKFSTDSISFDLKENNRAFIRMLAKIAHGLAWAIYGGDSFRPFLRETILGTEVDVGYYVGIETRDKQISPFDRPMLHRYNHRIWLWTHNIIVFQITLFEYLSSPTYTVVVGEFTPTADCLSKHRLVRDGGSYRSVLD